MNMYLILILFTAVYVRSSLAISACVDFNSDLQRRFLSGQKLDTDVFQSEGPYSLRGCIKECWLQSRCRVVTYHRSRLTCELGGHSAVISSTSDQNYVTSYRNNWPLDLEFAGACKSHHCMENEKCVALKSGAYHCMVLVTCEPGWITFGNKCFWFGPYREIWKNAQNACAAHTANLARIESESVNTFLTKEAQARGIQTVLIGANDIKAENDWRWGETGPSVGWSNWAPGSPGSRSPSEDCGAIINSGKWMDVSCNYRYQFICERPLF